MKIAITKGTLKVPPTYFALAHAEMMRDQHDFVFFTLVSELLPDVTSVPIHDSVPIPRLGFRRREILMPAFIARMGSHIRASRPDLIHQHFGTWAVPAVEASRRSRTPLVTTLHGADVFSFARTPSTMMARWHHRNVIAANAQSSRLLAVSRFLADTAIQSGMDAAKLEVHYQGIDTDYFTPDNERLGTTDAEPVILFVGGLSERKGIRDLIEASTIAHSRSPHRLVIAGDGELRDEVIGLMSDKPQIEFVGPQDRSAIRAWMRNARVLVVPSRSYNGWREAAGLVALEAAACGTPVIASDCGGLGEMMIDGTTGLLVGEGQPHEIARAIDEVLRLPQVTYAAMSSAARSFVVESRSLKRSCNDLAAHYDALV